MSALLMELIDSGAPKVPAIQALDIELGNG